ncbi:hypothetical protein HDE_06587 [Halotydeus destructor]|nr:hypothetical protein HDE_06587 [Halotydeus destructor]
MMDMVKDLVHHYQELIHLTVDRRREKKISNVNSKTVPGQDGGHGTPSEQLTDPVLGSKLNEQCNISVGHSVQIIPMDKLTLNGMKRKKNNGGHCLPGAGGPRVAIEKTIGSQRVTQGHSKAGKTVRVRSENPAYGYVKRTPLPNKQSPSTLSACSSVSCCFDASCPALVQGKQQRTSLSVSSSTLTLPARGHRMVQGTVLAKGIMASKTLPRLKRTSLGAKSSDNLVNCSACCAQQLTVQPKRPSKCDQIRNRTRTGSKNHRSSSADTNAILRNSKSHSAHELSALPMDHLKHSPRGGSVTEAVNRLQQASPSSPLELSFVVMKTARLRPHAEPATDSACSGRASGGPEDGRQILTLGTLVTALYSRKLPTSNLTMLFVRTPHGQEGYVMASSCEPLSSLPCPLSQQAALDGPPPLSKSSPERPPPKRLPAGHATNPSASSLWNASGKLFSSHCYTNNNTGHSLTKPSLTATTEHRHHHQEQQQHHRQHPGDDDHREQSKVPTSQSALIARNSVDGNQNYVRLSGRQVEGAESGTGNLLVVRSPCPQALSEMKMTNGRDNGQLLPVVKGDIVVCDDDELGNSGHELIWVKRHNSEDEGYIPRKWAMKVAVL